MRKHINDTIGAKHEEMKTEHQQRDGPDISKHKQLFHELDEIKNKQAYLLKLMDKI
jgi:hypothetical protein